MADKKITLLGSAITDLPNTSIALLQKISSQTPFGSEGGSFCNPKQKMVQSSILELLQMTKMCYFLTLLLRQLISNKLKQLGIVLSGGEIISPN